MNRRSFIANLSALSAGLIVGNEALEMFEQLNWKKKYWSGFVNPYQTNIKQWFEYQSNQGVIEYYSTRFYSEDIMTILNKKEPYFKL